MASPTSIVQQVVALANLNPADFDVGGARVAGLISAPLSTYLYKKAINANATLVGIVPSGVLPVDAMVTYTRANAASASDGSLVMMAATGNIPAPSNGDFELLVLSPWLTSLGYTTSSSTTNAAMIAALRTAALIQNYGGSSVAGGSTYNTADLRDPNNAYLVATL